jgi:HK97 family phage portal protein
MLVSAVYGCVRVLSDSVAKLPMPLYKRTSAGREQVTDHPANYVLSVRPNPYMTPFVFKKLLETHRNLWGNAYAYIVWDGNGNVQSLWPLNPAVTVPYLDPETGALWYVTRLRNGEYRKIPEEDIIHLKCYSEDGITGIPVIQHARESIGSEQAAQKFAGSFFSKGAKPSGVLEVPTQLNPDAKRKIRAEFERMTSGLDNVHRVAILDLGQKYTPISMPLKDAQFVESRQWNVHDISRYFGVPLYKLNEGKESYNSNEQQSIDFVVNTLAPIITQWEQEFTYKLFTDRELKKYYLKFNLAAELRGDNQSRAAYYEKMVQIGAYSLNDVLELEDKNRIDGGDVHLVSLNYVPLSYLEEYQKAKAGIGGDKQNGNGEANSSATDGGNQGQG